MEAAARARSSHSSSAADAEQQLASGAATLSLEEEEEQEDASSPLPPPLGGGHFDCILTNPPFGTQKHSNGVDMAFLRAALCLATPTGAVYSLHKTSTRKFIAKTAAEWGVQSAKVVAELQFSIPKMYKHHKKASLDVAVDFWQLRVEAPPP